MTAAETIREARKRLGLNTSDFGARLGVSGRTVEDWEQGRRQPSASALLLLEHVMLAHRVRA